MLTPHISIVHVPVNAIGKNRRSVFFLPKLSLNLICFGPSLVFVGKVKSGAFVPTASGIENFSIRSTSTRSKRRSTTRDGTFLVAFRNRALCRRFDRYCPPDLSRRGHYSRRRGHSPNDARRGQKRWLENN